MNRFAKMKKERIYTLFETLSKNAVLPDFHSIQDIITTNYAGQRQYPTKGYPQAPKIDLFQATQDKTVSL